MPPSYRLVRNPAAVRLPPLLDDAARAVVEHRGGPLRVLAGPGTGKTTTLVEHVASLVDGGASPDQVLVLTFSRKAAAELRERISARLGRTVHEPLARTFHSYAFGLLRREAALTGEAPPRLLSGPEQDYEIRELLRGEIDEGALRWPAELRPALGLRGFVAELRDLLLRAEERGLSPAELERLGTTRGRPDWVAAGGFLRSYQQRFDVAADPAYDTAGLISAALALFDDDAALAAERGAHPFVLVDEFQDVDPLQVVLLQRLAGGGQHLVVVGDPDQSIYAFRGSDPRALADFPDLFRTVTGAEAPTVALRHCRRSGPALVEATRRVAARLPGPRAQRDLVAAGPADVAEPVSAHVFPSASAEAAFVADALRRAHLEAGVPWDRMAVLVRTTRNELSTLRRSLASAGVPVGALADEMPLVEQPALQPLLLALRCVANPEAITGDVAVALLQSPLGGADALALRRLRSVLRRDELTAGGARSSTAILAGLLRDPRDLVALHSAVARPAERVVRALQAGTAAAEVPGATVEDVLWAVWNATGLARRWGELSRLGGAAGRAADRDLDAVIALFAAAERFTERLPRLGVAEFLRQLEGQLIPGDTLAPSAPAGDSVRIMTAHAAKGLEWDVVVVSRVQEGVWPDLRARGSLLGTEQLVDVVAGRDTGPSGRLAEALAEERRLFYVAATRARRRLIVTAVANEVEGDQPSRFLDEICPWPGDDERPFTRPLRALAGADLVASLRRNLVDPEAAPGERGQAASVLAQLAAGGVRGAHPEQWWGLPPLSTAEPLAGPDDEIRVSPSKVDSVRRCTLRWLLESIGATDGSGTAQALGTLVHRLAERLVAAPDLSRAELIAELDECWRQLGLPAGWTARAQHRRAEQMVDKLLAWHRANPRTPLAAEASLDLTLGRVRLHGQADRIEADEEGRLHVVDFKTGRTAIRLDEVAENAQLAAYQLGIRHHGFEGLDGEPGGAELVYLGTDRKSAAVLDQEALTGDWAEQLVAEAGEAMAGSEFPAQQNASCGFCPVRTSCPAQDDGRAVTA